MNVTKKQTLILPNTRKWRTNQCTSILSGYPLLSENIPNAEA